MRMSCRPRGGSGDRYSRGRGSWVSATQASRGAPRGTPGYRVPAISGVACLGCGTPSMLKAATRFATMTDPLQTTSDSSTMPAAGLAAFVEKTPLERYLPPAKPSLVGLSRAQLAEALATVGVPPAQRKMRVQQIWHWLYVRGACDFDAMTSVSKELRAALAANFTLERPEVVAEQISTDGTRKWLLRLPGEHVGERPHEIECVYIPETDRGTLCLSSQVGCTLTCSFCHTGTQRLVRNLTPGEIVGQIVVARDRLGDWLGTARASGNSADGEGRVGQRLVSNIVMTGMGEPLYNFEAVRDALLIAADGEGIAIS